MDNIRYASFLLLLLAAVGSCHNTVKTNADHISGDTLVTLSDARKGFVTRLTKKNKVGAGVETPPAKLFSVVSYPSNIGTMKAYLSKPPADGKLRPAIIWISGGFGNDIGDVWRVASASNDQTAAAFWRVGIVTMYPAQRGGNNNPGYDESGFGEVDDILAAAAFLARQPGVDTSRIYLGGHSTGGTKVLLAAECSKRFRAVFSFGPTESMSDYGEEYVTYNLADTRETKLRTPADWLSSIQSPVYVFEGSVEPGNLNALRALKKIANRDQHSWLHFYEVQRKDHFSILQPVCKLIAQKILKDDQGSVMDYDFEKDLAVIR